MVGRARSLEGVVVSKPLVSVVVASHDRPLRLRWLLNALEEQSLARSGFEVVVGHDSAGPETGALLEHHPLAADGTLRGVALPPGTAPPGANRNAAWRAARAPLVVFTDDDCRPPADWLERVLQAAAERPGLIVQGQTRPDPDEWALLRAPFRHTQFITPPSGYGEACNIVYPRAVLERAGGFDETLYTGEDADLMLRCRELGVDCIGDERMRTYHAVVPQSFYGLLRSRLRWKDMPEIIRRHPVMRERFPMWMFWKPTHVWFPLAVAAALLSRRGPLYALLAVPWCVHALPQHGTDPRGRLRALSELPAWAAVDAVEFAVLAYGSARSRTLFL